MAQTRPRLEQITFKSAKTGAHNIDTYLEAAELGNRTLAQLMSDLFDDNGNFAPEEVLPEFRIDQTGGETKLQYRTGGDGTFEDLVGFFNDRGAFSTSTSYKALDLTTITTGQVVDLYIVKSDLGTVASQSAFISDSRTQLLNTTSAGILADIQDARDDVLQNAGFIAVSTDLQATPSKIETVGDNLGANQAVTVVADDLNLGTSSLVKKVADDIANVNLVGPSIANVNTVAPHVGVGQDVTIVADDLDDGLTSSIKITADNIDDVTTVADNVGTGQAITTVANDLNATPSNIANFVGGLDATIDDLTIQGVAKGAIDSTSNTTFDMSTANNYVFDRGNGATLTLSNAHLCANMQPFTVVIKENGSSSLTISATTGTIKYANNLTPTLDGVSGRLVILTGFVLDPDTVTPANTTIVVCHTKVYN